MKNLQGQGRPVDPADLLDEIDDPPLLPTACELNGITARRRGVPARRVELVRRGVLRLPAFRKPIAASRKATATAGGHEPARVIRMAIRWSCPSHHHLTSDEKAVDSPGREQGSPTACGSGPAWRP
jgi:hypothetical protein